MYYCHLCCLLHSLLFGKTKSKLGLVTSDKSEEPTYLTLKVILEKFWKAKKLISEMVDNILYLYKNLKIRSQLVVMKFDHN